MYFLKIFHIQTLFPAVRQYIFFNEAYVYKLKIYVHEQELIFCNVVDNSNIYHLDLTQMFYNYQQVPMSW